MDSSNTRTMRCEVRPSPTEAIDAVHPRLFGTFVEQMGRAVYGGIYEPGHRSASSDGFREDVRALTKELGVTTVRYPGGNFVSGYRWEDGIGPIEDRPVRLDLAWHSTEPNTIGLHEFAEWVDSVDGELMLAVNLGTRGLEEALELLEYVNYAGRSTMSDRRRANGREKPFNVRMWCLGNELDGEWQLGALDADEYGKLAGRVARAFRKFDPALQLVVCGSSASFLPTFGEWERTVLGHTYEDVDFISCHAYYEESDGDVASFLAAADHMQSVIADVSAAINHVRSIKRSAHQVRISFDEWNVWYQSHQKRPDALPTGDSWPVGPPILEDQYTVADAVVVGSLLITLLNNADVVHAACMAQLVNVIGPIITAESGPAVRQTTFFPFAETATRARGRVMRTSVSSPLHTTAAHGDVESVVAATTYDCDTGAMSIFLANRNPEHEIVTELNLAQFAERVVQSAMVLSHADPHATNTLTDPTRVQPVALEVVPTSRGVAITLPACGWAFVSLNVSLPSDHHLEGVFE